VTVFDDDPLPEVSAPDLPYRPSDPAAYDPGIGLVGCGDIAEHHLRAYDRAGYDVCVLCDRTREKARALREAFFPDADVTTDADAVFAREDVAVVDLATRPADREPLIEGALRAGKHVLSQKPFVRDLEFGERMVDLAREQGVELAVNQNGRWAPGFAYLREAVAAGLVGDVTGVHLSEHWDHDRPDDPEFEAMRHAVLYDFAVHWFDLLRRLLPDRDPERVYASTAYSPTQETTPPLLGQAVVEYDRAQASLAFDGHTRVGTEERSYVTGTEGTIESTGPNWQEQSVTLYTDEGYATPELEGAWFPDGFHGAMAELLSAVEESRRPANDAADNLETMALTFAAIESADDHEPKAPGEVRRLPTDPDWPP
jgi:predicted dehydrogenase